MSLRGAGEAMSENAEPFSPRRAGISLRALRISEPYKARVPMRILREYAARTCLGGPPLPPLPEPPKDEEITYSGRRMRLRRLATPPWADRKAIAAIYAKARRASLKTGIQHHVDHEIPLQGRTVCGLHVETNLRVIPATDNLRRPRIYRP